MVPQYDDLDDYLNHQRRTMTNPLLLILGLIAAICGVVTLLDVSNPEVVIAIGLMAAGTGLVVLAA